jgi:DIS3-like exonuclease 2
VDQFWDSWKSEILSAVQSTPTDDPDLQDESKENDADSSFLSGQQSPNTSKRSVNFKLYCNIPAEVQKMTAIQFSNFSFSQHCLQRSGKVVRIMKAKLQNYAGNLKFESSHAIFMPLSAKLPRAFVAFNTLPKAFMANRHRYTKCIFLAEIIHWDVGNRMPDARIKSKLGFSGEIGAETNAILLENNVDCSDFPDDISNHLPQIKHGADLVITKKEANKRIDLRDECVFTIDPETARDLDDALSIKSIGTVPESNLELFEVGVHIADVAHWVKENDPIDTIAQQRTTSYYCVQKVIPMLPHLLCNTICSLNPGEDKFTFSVFWHIDSSGKVHKTWFGKSVIRSCVKLSYDIAYDLMTDPSRDWDSKKDLPKLHGKHSYKKIAHTVHLLDKLAIVMRRKRFESGGIEFKREAIKFIMDDKNENPLGFMSGGNKSSYVVEEFMLLANISVAEKLYHHYPTAAVLRKHDRPSDPSMMTFQETCRKINFDFNISNSKEMQMSLERMRTDLTAEVSQAISFRLLRTMKQASYFVGGCSNTHHFGLGVPLYTHFTSPIRRYPDILVHRQLAALIDSQPMPSLDSKQMAALIERCNESKTASRLVSEGSIKLFLSIYISQTEALELEGIVINVMENSFECFLTSVGLTVSVHCDKLDLKSHDFEAKRSLLRLKFSDESKLDREICLYQKVKLSVSVPDSSEPFTWIVILAD